jgi:hypothetical protein
MYMQKSPLKGYNDLKMVKLDGPCLIKRAKVKFLRFFERRSSRMVIIYK